MFRKPTVFVLGAGASWHYGYPTGEQLVDDVIDMARRFGSECTQAMQSPYQGRHLPKFVRQYVVGADTGKEARALAKVKGDCDRLVERLQTVRPLVIDYFLFQNPSLRAIGTLMIAAVILEREAVWLKVRGNDNRRQRHELRDTFPYDRHKDRWDRFIVHKLLNGCEKSSDLLSNNVHFITFNYDASLEYNLYRSLDVIDMFEKEDIVKFFEDRILHVYGCVHSRIPTEADSIDLNVMAELGKRGNHADAEKLEQRMRLVDKCWDAAQRLRTIDQHDKDHEGEAIRSAVAHVRDAKVAFILGYGFDANNNKRIGLDQMSITRGVKTVLFTNFGDPNSVNKKVSNLLMDSFSYFLRESIQTNADRSKDPFYFEKSTGDVYQALERDFDAVEEGKS